MCRNADEEKGRPVHNTHFTHSMPRDATNVSRFYFFHFVFTFLTSCESFGLCLSVPNNKIDERCSGDCRAVGFISRMRRRHDLREFPHHFSFQFNAAWAFMAKDSEGRVNHCPRLLNYICLYLMLNALRTLNGRHSVLCMKAVMFPSYNSNELNFKHHLNRATPAVLNI